MGIVTMKELLEAGVHFGHQTRRWDPHMKPYIFTERNGIHIIDLQKTIAQLKIAYNAIKEMRRQAEQAAYISFQTQLKSDIATLMPNYGSVNVRDYDTPKGYQQVCFADLDEGSPVFVAGYELIRDSVESDILKNVFLWPQGSKSFYAGNITVENGFKCFEISSGRINIRLRSLGRTVEIFE